MKSESKSKAYPKLIVLGTDGNAGKTTISRLVLERNLDSLPAVEAEAVADANASGTKNRLTVRDARTGKPMLVAALLAEVADKAIIIDVGTNLYHTAIDTLAEPVRPLMQPRGRPSAGELVELGDRRAAAILMRLVQHGSPSAARSSKVRGPGGRTLSFSACLPVGRVR